MPSMIGNARPRTAMLPNQWSTGLGTYKAVGDATSTVFPNYMGISASSWRTAYTRNHRFDGGSCAPPPTLNTKLDDETKGQAKTQDTMRCQVLRRYPVMDQLAVFDNTNFTRYWVAEPQLTKQQRPNNGSLGNTEIFEGYVHASLQGLLHANQRIVCGHAF
jgi:hypothetical protein